VDVGKIGGKGTEGSSSLYNQTTLLKRGEKGKER
jgi:hypothetical protein